jgi:pimeloyl-ACP methyl ester carboxylesterase
VPLDAWRLAFVARLDEHEAHWHRVERVFMRHGTSILTDSIRRHQHAAAIAVGLLVCAGIAGAEETPVVPDAATWYAAYLRHSRLVPLPGGRTLNIHCIGSGSPTVVLESGIGEFAFTWWAVQDRIAKETRVCAYDRAGLGRSPAGPLPRDTRAEVADLEALLPAAGISPPYVLVGHSMGGYNVRLFASRHLHDVAGIVLVDPSVENQVPILEAAVPEIARQDRIAVTRAQACADPARSDETASLCIRAAPDGFPAELARTFVSSQGLTQSATFASEVESFLGVASQQVVTEWTLWNRMHQEVATLSTGGSNQVVEGAGHYIQLDKPDAVVDSVCEVVREARNVLDQ